MAIRVRYHDTDPNQVRDGVSSMVKLLRRHMHNARPSLSETQKLTPAQLQFS